MIDVNQSTPLSLSELQTRFLAILPVVERHARIYFRNLACSHRRADAVAETTALCWRWFARLAVRGKDASAFPATLAAFVARQVRCGRRLAGQESGKDALSPSAQIRRGFLNQGLPANETGVDHSLADALRDNARSPVPAQVAFRLDFPRWRRLQSGRCRRLIDFLMAGERTSEAARRFGLSEGRVSQLRRAFHEDWQRFCDDEAAT